MLASPNATIQSIGRGLRKAKDKTRLEYFDFFNRTNFYLKQHSKRRLETLRSEGHDVAIVKAKQ